MTKFTKTCYHGANADHPRLGAVRGRRGGRPASRRLVSRIEESPDGHVVVEVRTERVRLNRADVEIRTEAPDHWSVVVRTAVLRPTPGGKGMEVVGTYAVCPLCHYRQDFAGKPANLRCVRCGATSPVDWTETC